MTRFGSEKFNEFANAVLCMFNRALACESWNTLNTRSPTRLNFN